MRGVAPLFGASPDAARRRPGHPGLEEVSTVTKDEKRRLVQREEARVVHLHGGDHAAYQRRVERARYRQAHPQKRAA